MGRDFVVGDRVEIHGPEGADWNGHRGTIDKIGENLNEDELSYYNESHLIVIDGNPKPRWIEESRLKPVGPLDLMAEIE